ncbi:Uncharacterized protein APZ42_025963, partial [Daphnia magna]
LAGSEIGLGVVQAGHVSGAIWGSTCNLSKLSDLATVGSLGRGKLIWGTLGCMGVRGILDPPVITSSFIVVELKKRCHHYVIHPFGGLSTTKN